MNWNEALQLLFLFLCHVRLCSPGSMSLQSRIAFYLAILIDLPENVFRHVCLFDTDVQLDFFHFLTQNKFTIIPRC